MAQALTTVQGQRIGLRIESSELCSIGRRDRRRRQAPRARPSWSDRPGWRGSTAANMAAWSDAVRTGQIARLRALSTHTATARRATVATKRFARNQNDTPWLLVQPGCIDLVASAFNYLLGCFDINFFVIGGFDFRCSYRQSLIFPPKSGHPN